MTIVKKTILLLCFCLASIMTYAAPNWELKKDKDGIKIYTAAVSGTNIKAIKATLTIQATLSSLMALLMDTKAHEQWVYNTQTSYLVKQLSPDHQVYYSEIKMPWPIANRDVVVDINISQQAATKAMYISANAVDNYMPVVKDKVRVAMSKVNWIVTPISNNELSIEYIAQVDPAGAIPAWIVNMFSTKGPFETFKKLREMVVLPAYQQAHYSFIKD